jgi:putative zinc finger protein
VAEIDWLTNMQKFAPIDATSSRESCPTDEELAAYIDGNLGRRAYKRITEHLASCEGCYAVYVGAVRFQLETEPADEAAAAARNVMPFPSRDQIRGLWRLAAVAAGLLIVAGAGGGYYFAGPLPKLVTSGVTAPVRGNPVATGGLWLGPTYRGGGDEGAEAPLDPASFQMGVQLVNLQLSLEAGQGKQAQDIVARILNILQDQYLVEDLKKGYTEITTAIANGTPPQKLAGKASELARQAREAFNAPHLDLGQWVEAGQLAAAAGEPSFFQRGDTRAFLRRLLWRQKLGIGEMTLEPAARQHLTDIWGLLEKRSLDRSDYGKLSQNLRAILNIYYPES